jgi:hypothetical protein
MISAAIKSELSVEPIAGFDSIFVVKSSSGHGYLVKRGPRIMTCTCKDHLFRSRDCKHIQAVQQLFGGAQ